MRIVHFIISLILIAAIFQTLPAGTTGSLVGTVRDDQTKEVLPGAVVLIENTALGTQTNDDGSFFIHNIPAGEYTVVFQLISYKKKIVQHVSISPDGKTRLNVSIDPKAISGDAVVVQAEMPVVRKDITASQYVVAQKEIEALPVTTVGQVLDARAGVVEGGHVRGGRSEEVIYLIDGVPLNQTISGGLGSYLPVEAIQEMTILTGGWDSEFGNASSGVVNIITRRASSRTELGLKYENDHLFGGNRDNRYQRVSLSFSSPLRKKKFSFWGVGVLQRDDTRYWWDFTGNPDKPLHHQYSILSNLNYDLNGHAAVGLQLLYSDEATQEYDYSWRYNLQGLPSSGRKSVRAVLNYSHNLTKKSFIDAKLSYYRISDRLNELDREELSSLEPYSYDVFLLYVIRGNRIWWKRATEQITSLRSKLTTFTILNQYVRAGFDFDYYNISQDLVKFEPQRSIWGKPLVDEPLLNYSNFFDYNPYSGAAYIQTKWETPEGSHVNLGFRYDFLNPRAETPVISIPGQAQEFKDDSVRWSPASVKHQFSPRLGFGMPVLENSFLFINYGWFFQVPLFEQFYTGLNSDFRFSQRALIGNPDLPPMKSRIFEISYRHTLEKDYAIIFTGAHKKTTNLVDVSTFVGYDSKLDKNRGYGQYITAPFAETVNFEVVLKKRPGTFLGGELNYTYSVAKAISDHENAAFEYLQWGFNPDYELYYVSWDQRHTINLNLNFLYRDLLNASIISRYASPRPYTYFPSLSRNGIAPQNPSQRITPNNRRMRHTFSTDIKVQLNLNNLLGRWVRLKGKWNMYADIRNLFNRKNVIWMSADGRIGGELNDPAAYSVGQRIRLGMDYTF